MLLHHYICIVLFGISISSAERDVGPITKHLRLLQQADLDRGETKEQGQKLGVHDGYDFKGEIADQPNKFNRPQSINNEFDKPLTRNKRYRGRAEPKRVRGGLKGEADSKRKKKANSGGLQMNIIIGVCLGVISLGVGAYALFKYQTRGKDTDGDKGKGKEKEHEKGKKDKSKKVSAKKGKDKKSKKKAKDVEEEEDEDEGNEDEDEDEEEGEGENEDAEEEKED